MSLHLHQSEEPTLRGNAFGIKDLHAALDEAKVLILQARERVAPQLREEVPVDHYMDNVLQAIDEGQAELLEIALRNNLLTWRP
jgi:hypothetical protein